ncbi:MAG: 3-phosphoserine/phosphohydroxythreonine transaminase [Gammaproteobacteria bacterium]|nr:3-phosphoserine/phosphohydroxythreonine transaminase [Gammaproteobacteria bacterium]
MSRLYNFGAGPAALPEAVLKKAQAELLNWHDTGMSILEIGHRTPEFMQQVAEKTEQDLRALLHIPENYRVLFLAGGGQSQFGMVPLNLLSLNKHLGADYIDTGVWSRKAITEAQRYGKINIAASSAASHYTDIPSPSAWTCNNDAAYLHYTSNETIGGLAFPFIPETEVPLVADMTSSLLSEPLDVSRFGLIYAGAQKNISAAGLTIVIIRDDLLGHALPFTPTLWNYQTHDKAKSLFNTPPVFAWYLAGLVFDWIKEQGGLEEIKKINSKKAELIYHIIDESEGFYKNPIQVPTRSKMNIPFFLPSPELEKTFVSEAFQHNLANLRGHKLSGGIRASLYNAVTLEATQALANFMKTFAKKYA